MIYYIKIKLQKKTCKVIKYNKKMYYIYYDSNWIIYVYMSIRYSFALKLIVKLNNIV